MKAKKRGKVEDPRSKEERSEVRREVSAEGCGWKGVQRQGKNQTGKEKKKKKGVRIFAKD